MSVSCSLNFINLRHGPGLSLITKAACHASKVGWSKSGKARIDGEARERVGVWKELELGEPPEIFRNLGHQIVQSGVGIVEREILI